MTTITNTELQNENVIVKLNTELANFRFFRVKKNDSLIVSLISSDFKKLSLKNTQYFFDISNNNPYMHIMLFYEDFTHVEVD